jgi:hypothetical protein
MPRWADDFFLHVLPDACVNILFNVADTRIAAITALQVTHEVLNLGKTFHYTGVQLLPGVWQGNRDEIFDTFVDTPYSGSLPLIETSGNLSASDFPANQLVLSELVRRLVHEKQIVANTVIEKILASIPDIRTVADMAVIAGISPRHLQRADQAGDGSCSARPVKDTALATLVQGALPGAIRRPVALYSLVS